MGKTALIIILLILLVQPASASFPNPFDVGVEMIRDGFIAFIRSIGDESYGATGVNGTAASMDTYVTMAALTFDPFEFQKVKELNFISSVIAFLYMLLYIGGGAAWAVICRISPGAGRTVSEITDIDRDVAGNQYIKNIFTAIFVLLFAHVIVRFVLILNYVLTSLVAKYTLVSTVDTSSNWVLYAFSGLVFLVNVLFFCWRLIVICSIASFSLVLGAMLVWGYTRAITISIFKYFIAVTFLQLIIVIIIAAGMIVLDVVRGFNLQAIPIPFMNNLDSFVLIVILISSIIVSGAVCLGPVIRPVINVVVRAVV